jgi:FtsH-binding integral membrane protein
MGNVVSLIVLVLWMFVLVAYGAKTFNRNWDWMTEESLFVSAMEVRLLSSFFRWQNPHQSRNMFLLGDL